MAVLPRSTPRRVRRPHPPLTDAPEGGGGAVPLPPDEEVRARVEAWDRQVHDGSVQLLGEPTHDPVEVVPYDPAWPERFAALRDRLVAALGPFEGRIEHVGSTSVPGLAAKPILDLQVSVRDLEDEDAYRPAIESMGWPLRAREPGHRYFRTLKGVRPRIHVHVCQVGSAWERDHLLFRDYLRTHPERAQAYEAVKRALGDRYREDRMAYTEAKTPFIAETLRLAEAWAAETAWQP